MIKPINKSKLKITTTLIVVLILLSACEKGTDLSPKNWRADYDTFMEAQLVEETKLGVATGQKGAVTVARNALAARAGLEALQ